jgi:hypothetical protein
MSRWSFIRDEDPYRGRASAGYLQREPGGSYQVWWTWNSWNFAWIAFFREQDRARQIVDGLCERLDEELRLGIHEEGLRRIEEYLERITALSECPVPEEMDAVIHEDLRRRHGLDSGLRVDWPFSEPSIRLVSTTFLGVWPVTSNISGVWISLDAGNTFAWVALYGRELDAHWAVLVLEKAIEMYGGFATASRAEELLLEAVVKSEFPVPTEMDGGFQAAIRQDFEVTRKSQQHWEKPTYTRDLSLFRLFYESNRQHALETTESMRNVMLSGQVAEVAYDPSFLLEIGLMQRSYCLDHARVIYLEPSVLKMCDALLGPSPEEPDFPEEPLWIQPLAPLSFRGGLVRGLWLYDSYNVDRVDQLPFSRPEEKVRAKRYIERKHGMHQVEIFFDNPANQTSLWQGKILLLGEYDTQHHTWVRISEGHECLSGQCTIETLGDRDVLLQCERCQEEFDHWTQWLQILFWAIQGKFRRVEDSQSFEELELPFMEEKTGKRRKQQKGREKRFSGEKSRRYHVTIVRYDASYFKPVKNRGRRSSLLDSHIVLTTEEALKEGVMDVDMSGVLIRDFTYRSGFTRHLVHPRFKKSEVQVKPKEEMPQLVTLATWKARQKQRMEALHKQADIYASTYEEGSTKEDRNDDITTP